jgi:hypothetical protein
MGSGRTGRWDDEAEKEEYKSKEETGMETRDTGELHFKLRV